jgi:hypothetical protein
MLTALVVACAASVVSIAQGLKPASPVSSGGGAPKDCAGLTALKLLDVRISDAAAVPAAATGV